MGVTFLSPEIQFRAFTSLGVTAPGAQLYTYSSGSTFLQTAYTDSTGLTALPNPVIADAGGLFPAIWLTNNLAYRIVVYDQNGLLIWGPVDGITLGPAATVAASILTGQVAVANGGTGQATLTAHGVLIGEGTSAIAQTATGGVGFLLTGQGGSADPVFQAQDNSINDFRMTLTSVTPVTTVDVTAATTIFWTPYRGNRIALYDGSSGWNVRTSAEISIAVPGTTSQMYDLFVFDSAGTPTLEALAWTNDTTRATVLVLQDGVLVKSGAPTRRYVGSFRTTTVSGQTEDSVKNRYCWNYYNRVRRVLLRQETTATWTYSTATWRQANGAAANQVNFVVGYAEVLLSMNLGGAAANTNANVAVAVAIGLDSSTTPATGQLAGSMLTQILNQQVWAYASYLTMPAIGAHVVYWLEFSAATPTTTWYGTGFVQSSQNQSGLSGWIEG